MSLFDIFNYLKGGNTSLDSETPSLLGIPSNGHSFEFLVTRQSFVESALASPPICVLLHQLSPSSTCILDAGVFSRPSKTTEIENPLGLL